MSYERCPLCNQQRTTSTATEDNLNACPNNHLWSASGLYIGKRGEYDDGE